MFAYRAPIDYVTIVSHFGTECYGIHRFIILGKHTGNPLSHRSGTFETSFKQT